MCESNIVLAYPQPIGNRAEWVRDSDFERARAAHESGRTGLQLFVGPDGRVDACVVESSSGFRKLDAETCEILARRATFRIPTGPGCRFYYVGVRWQKPE